MTDELETARRTVQRQRAQMAQLRVAAMQARDELTRWTLYRPEWSSAQSAIRSLDEALKETERS